MSEEQKKLLLDLQIADFNVIEWVLYMHTHPSDFEGCQKRKDAMKIAAKIRRSYEALYGSLTHLTPISCSKPNCTPWPWHV